VRGVSQRNAEYDQRHDDGHRREHPRENGRELPEEVRGPFDVQDRVPVLVEDVIFLRDRDPLLIHEELVAGEGGMIAPIHGGALGRPRVPNGAIMILLHCLQRSFLPACSSLRV